MVVVDNRLAVKKGVAPSIIAVHNLDIPTTRF
jgi:hypothetical protein